MLRLIGKEAGSGIGSNSGQSVSLQLPSLQAQLTLSALGCNPYLDLCHEFSRCRLADMDAVSRDKLPGCKIERGPWLGHSSERHLLDRLSGGRIHDGGNDTHRRAGTGGAAFRLRLERRFSTFGQYDTCLHVPGSFTQIA